MPKRIITVGAGSGGLVVAIAFASVGYESVLIEKGYIGGDCTNYGCVPSKTLLHSSQKFYESHQFIRDNLGKDEAEKVMKKAYQVLEHTREIREEFRHHESIEWLEGLGIKVIKGYAEFADKNNFKITDKTYCSDPELLNSEDIIHFDKALLAVGSSPIIPNIKGLKDTPFLTNEHIFELDHIPQSLAIIGNGPIGIEMAEAFTNLGCKVTVIGRRSNILLRSDQELTEELKRYLENKGIQFHAEDTTHVSHTKSKAFHLNFHSGGELQAEQLLVAVGRKPNLHLNLETGNVNFTKQGITIDKYGRTSNPNVYAVGDCTDVPRFTHFAYHMGKKVGTNLILQKFLKLPIHISSWKTDLVPAVTFTSIELAQAGLTEQEAKDKYNEKVVHTYHYQTPQSDRAKTYNNELYHIKFVTKGFWDTIIGVHILGSRAGEILPEFQDMIRRKKSIRDLEKLIRAYPTFNSSIDQLSRQWMKRKLGRG
jgi:pyruvate/2-oxoglutarate dehydrogenase complex dihydrolipoamide dehydrogenase (E3) component